MSENDVEMLREQMRCMERKILKEISSVRQEFNNLRVHLAEDYVPKKDFNDYKKDQKIDQRHKATISATISGIIVGAIVSIINMFRSNP